MKRFTETDKWRNPWFRRLGPIHKCLWSYLVDNCDHAGVIEPDWELASFQIGAQVSMLDLSAFEDQVEQLDTGKLLIRDFVTYQYGQLSDECRAHGPVFAALKRHGLVNEDRVSKGYPKGIQYLKDKDKDKDKDNRVGVQGKGDDAGEPPMALVITPEDVYLAYPRKVAKQDALKAIVAASRISSLAHMLDRTKAFAAAVESWKPEDQKFIPYPATWFRRGSYDDDPQTWQRDAIKREWTPPAGEY